MHSESIPSQDCENSTSLNGAEFVLRRLKEEGIDTIFGVPGGAISPFLQQLRKGGPRFIIAAHEAGAAFMADGYARSSGRLGVCMVTTGPGVTNALTGVASANLDQVPLLLISGHTPAAATGTSAMQESTAERGVNTVFLLSHSTRYSASVNSPLSLPRQLTRAFSIARSAVPGAVHLAIPSDVARAPITNQNWPVRALKREPKFLSGEASYARLILEELKNSRRPLIFLGSGARAALSQDDFIDLIRRLSVPVTTSVRAKGIFPETDSLSLGVFGISGDPRARKYVEEGTDFLVILGSSLGEWATGGRANKLANAETIVHVDLDAGIFGQNVPAHYAIECNIEDFLSDVHRSLHPDEEWHAARGLPSEQVQAPLEAAEVSSFSTSSLRSSALMWDLKKCLSPDLDMFVDVGNCTGWATRHLQIDPPCRIFIPTGLTSMGWSCGAVIGGKIASPHRKALSLVGDGSFLMNGTEVSTAARQGVGAVYLVLHDGYLGMVNHGESRQTGSSLSDPFYKTGPDDLLKFARSLGASVSHITRAGQLLRALPDAFTQAHNKRKPHVIVADVDYLEEPPYGDRFAAVAGGR